MIGETTRREMKFVLQSVLCFSHPAVSPFATVCELVGRTGKYSLLHNLRFASNSKSLFSFVLLHFCLSTLFPRSPTLVLSHWLLASPESPTPRSFHSTVSNANLVVQPSILPSFDSPALRPSSPASPTRLASSSSILSGLSYTLPTLSNAPRLETMKSLTFGIAFVALVNAVAIDNTHEAAEIHVRSFSSLRCEKSN